ncbi:hypothetical protein THELONIOUSMONK_86 [Mycobacterium phage TheloniousMonk]|uniref:hypothetical protein n=1 Tax=Mycobacterium phage TheloniousMonk TaxID=1701845 RepID=UPI0006BD89A8|nr:hypothetical protein THELONIOUSMONK_86 [Mycobacterium phage TheloniousMonk]ALA06228.1 hypothetical protein THELONIOUSMONK_86 [Mycobacterium phage TheloniousMonk]
MNAMKNINRDFYDMTPAEADEIRRDRYTILTGNGAYYTYGRYATWAKVKELLATVTTWAEVKQSWDGRTVWNSRTASTA